MSKFDEIKERDTNGANYYVSYADILNRLESWDSLYGVVVSDVTRDGLVVGFKSLPSDLDSLVREIYDFCPDVIEQHFGVMDEMIDMMEETGGKLNQEITELVEGVDFGDENFGELLLKKYLRLHKSVSLWWD